MCQNRLQYINIAHTTANFTINELQHFNCITQNIITILAVIQVTLHKRNGSNRSSCIKLKCVTANMKTQHHNLNNIGLDACTKSTTWVSAGALHNNKHLLLRHRLDDVIRRQLTLKRLTHSRR